MSLLKVGAAIDVDEAHFRALLGEMLDDRRANARAAAGYEHGAALEAWIGGEGCRHGTSQMKRMKDNLADELVAGGEVRVADLTVGVAYRLDAEERTSGRSIDNQMTHGWRRPQPQLKLPLRPSDRGSTGPTVEAIVELDRIHDTCDGEIPIRRDLDTLDGQDLGIGEPHGLRIE